MNLRTALRSLALRPGLTAVAVATLALGLGVNASIFSLTREILLRPLPYRDADRLVRVFEKSATLGNMNAAIAPANYALWRDRADAFEQVAPFQRAALNVVRNGSAIQVEGFRVAPSFFSMLGVAPALGRGFQERDAEKGRDNVVLLADGFWKRQFAGNPNVVGQTIDVDGTPCTIIGILPSSFKIFRVLNHELALFRPLVIDFTDREQSILMYAKLKPGASVDLARAQLASIYATLPAANARWTADATPLSEAFAANAKPILTALEWAAALVLLIACANIANLLLAASLGRKKELAVRQALGATPWRVARDLAGETAILAIAGLALAALLAEWTVALLNSNVSFQDINRLQPFRMDFLVLAFTGALALAAAMIFSLVPARAAMKTDLAGTLKDSMLGATPSISHRRLRHALIVAQLALSIVLAASALGITRSALKLRGLSRGISTAGVMTAQVSLSDPRYADLARLRATASTMLDRLRSAPGIADAAIVNYPPLSLIRVGVPISVDGHPPPSPDRRWMTRYFVTSPAYFRTAGIPILNGRDFAAADNTTSAGVAIVNETFARQFWNRIDVIGQRVTAEFPQSNAFWIPRARRGPLTIVGVVGDVREDGLLDGNDPAQLYIPYLQSPTIVLTLITRTSGGPAEDAMPAIRDAVRTADPQAPVSYEASYYGLIEETFARPREMAYVIGAFAALALLLSAAGVYGVTSYVTTARTREIGIRIALGARPADVVSMVAGHAMKLAAAGVAIGIVLAPMALRLTSSLLFGVGPFDPATLAAVAVLLALVVAAASAIPAIRAARLAAVTFR